MKKTVSVFIIILAVTLSCFVSIPKTDSATSDVAFVSHSWYIDDSGALWVVGDVQNTGQTIIRSVTVQAQVSTPNGVVADPATGPVWAKYLLPQQKAPFAFPIDNTDSQSGAWTGIAINDIELAVLSAEITPLYQYQGLKMTNKAYSIGSDGHYWISGEIQNVGDQTATGIQVVASFYNSEGVIVAAGIDSTLSEVPIEPNGKASYKLDAIDLDTTKVSSDRRIASYYVFTQVATPILTDQTQIPTVSATVDVGLAPVGSGDAPSDSTVLIIAAVAAVVAVVVVVVLALRKRKPKTKAVSQAAKTKQSKK